MGTWKNLVWSCFDVLSGGRWSKLVHLIHRGKIKFDMYTSNAHNDQRKTFIQLTLILILRVQGGEIRCAKIIISTWYNWYNCSSNWIPFKTSPRARLKQLWRYERLPKRRYFWWWCSSRRMWPRSSDCWVS